MLKLNKLAVTGGLSSGKSSVCRILKELGAYVVSADEVVHHLLSNDAIVIREIVNLLGADILVQGQIDRKKVADIVFKNPDLLREMEKIIHPVVYQEIELEYQQQANNGMSPPLFVAEVPLLFESGGEQYFAHSLAVISDEELCYQRFHKTTHEDREAFNLRMSCQLTQAEKGNLAEKVIFNNGTLDDLRQAVEKVYKEYC